MKGDQTHPGVNNHPGSCANLDNGGVPIPSSTTVLAAWFVIGSSPMNRPARRNVDGQVARVAETLDAPDAIICLGVILRGATTHAQVVSEIVSQQLGDIAVRKQLPIIHEVLLLENEQQARERCLSKTHNRGAEAAATAMEMAALMARLPKWHDDVPF